MGAATDTRIRAEHIRPGDQVHWLGAWWTVTDTHSDGPGITFDLADDTGPLGGQLDVDDATQPVDCRPADTIAAHELRVGDRLWRTMRRTVRTITTVEQRDDGWVWAAWDGIDPFPLARHHDPVRVQTPRPTAVPTLADAIAHRVVTITRPHRPTVTGRLVCIGGRNRGPGIATVRLAGGAHVNVHVTQLALTTEATP